METNLNSAKCLAEILLKYGVVKLSPNAPFTWASGLKSPIYCNNRELLSAAEDSDRDIVIDALRQGIYGNFEECLGVVGVATGAIPWGAMAAYTSGSPFGYVIAAPKDHGADSNQSSPEEEQAKLAKCLIGKFTKGLKIIIVEDLISTGGSSLHAVKAVRAAGYEVAGMIALFSYGFEEANKLFEEADCPVVTLSDYSHLLDVAVEKDYISEDQLETLKEWSKDCRAWSQARGGK